MDPNKSEFSELVMGVSRQTDPAAGRVRKRVVELDTWNDHFIVGLCVREGVVELDTWNDHRGVVRAGRCGRNDHHVGS